MTSALACGQMCTFDTELCTTTKLKVVIDFIGFWQVCQDSTINNSLVIKEELNKSWKITGVKAF